MRRNELIDKTIKPYLEWLKIKSEQTKFKAYLREKDKTLYVELLKFFEDFNNAYKEIIKATILKLNKRGFDLSWGNVRKESITLHSAAKGLFGSWENAIKAAGLYYGLLKKRVDKRIIQEISGIWKNDALHSKLIELVKNKAGVSEIIKKFGIGEDTAVNLFCMAVAYTLFDEKKIHSKEILDAESEDKIHSALERFWLPKNKITALQLEREIGRNLEDWGR